MTPYSPAIERQMRAFYQSLRENDRRRYAAIEAQKLGHGGIEYLARILDIDPKTIRRGRRELRGLSRRTSMRCWPSTPPAAPSRSRSSGPT